MLPGQRQCAIFGFCDIRNFTDATEILQEEVMVFVNTVAQVVHKAVDIFQGSTNKNIGDAFLLVWKIPEGIHFINIYNYHIHKYQLYSNHINQYIKVAKMLSCWMTVTTN